MRACLLLVLALLAGCDSLNTLSATPGTSGVNGLATVGGTTNVSEKSTAILTSYPLGGGNSANFPEKAFDGDPNTQWSSVFADDEWVGVDLGAAQPIQRVRVLWGSTGYGVNYHIEVSTDRQAWTEVARKDGGSGGTDELSFTPAQARYVRLHGDLPEHEKEFRYLVNEFEVYGAAGPNLAKGKPAEASSTIWNYFGDAELAKANQDFDAADARYRAGDYDGAFKAYQRILSEQGVALMGDRDYDRFGIFDELRLHMRAADFRRSHPGATGTQHRRAVMAIIPRVEVTMPTSPDDPTPLDASRALDEAQATKIQDNFFWFKESFLALTDGLIGWDLETVRATGKLTQIDTTWQADQNRYLLYPKFFDGLSPAQPELDEKLAKADLPILLWPGTKPHPTKAVTNGGAGGQAFRVNGQVAYRQGIWTEADDRVGHDLYKNNARFFHHELGHWLDGAYANAAFPKAHGFARRRDWPGTWEGRTESEFMEQLYRGVLGPTDQFAQIAARPNSLAANGQAVTDAIFNPTSTPTTEPTLAPLPVIATPPPASYEAWKAIDGDSSTAWATGPGDPQWLMLDLGRSQRVGYLQLQWGKGYARSWVAQTWNGRNWVTVGSTATGRGGTQGVRFTPQNARYLRVWVRTTAGTNGVELQEFRVFPSSPYETNLAPQGYAKASSER